MWPRYPDGALWSRPVPPGIAGGAVLAFTLPTPSVLGGVAVLGIGAVIWFLRKTLARHTGKGTGWTT